MNETLVSDLVAIIRRSTEPETGATELEELLLRARVFGATDEELGLSLGVLLAISGRPAGKP